MKCRSFCYVLPLVNLLVFLFYVLNWHSEGRGQHFASIESFPELRFAFCFWLSKKSLRLAGAKRALQQLGSLAVREHLCSQGNCCVFIWTWCILCSFLTAFSYCFLQICVIFTVFKEGKMFWIFCEVLIDFSKFVISTLLLGTISSFLSFIHCSFSWPIARSSLRFHVSYKYLSRTYMEIRN